MRKLLLLIFLAFAVFLFSCDLSSDSSTSLPGNFWALNTATYQLYRIDAELLAYGANCNVWAEKGSGVNRDTAEKVAKKYDDNIYSEMLNAFSFENVLYEKKTFADAMEFAGWLVNGDRKLNILLLDIKDNYNPNGNRSYVGGYFWEGNFFDEQYSNKKSMIYIDTYPGLSDKPGQMPDQIPERIYVTIAHEMQHLMNYVTSRVLKRPEMDLWINEGLSEASEWVYTGNYSSERLGWYNSNGSPDHNMKGLIDKGNNFFVWGNRGNEEINAVLDDYATVYLFFQWLRLQSNKDIGIYKNIISSKLSDYNAVTAAANATMPGQGFDNWETLLKTWLAANYFNSSGDLYGYKDKIEITTHWAPEETSRNLYPGEGVYSNHTDNPPTLEQNPNIGYATLGSGIVDINDFVYSGGVLLTYNANIKTNGQAEKGTTTGVASSAGIAAARQAMPARIPQAGLFAISAADMLRRNGHKNE